MTDIPEDAKYLVEFVVKQYDASHIFKMQDRQEWLVERDQLRGRDWFIDTQLMLADKIGRILKPLSSSDLIRVRYYFKDAKVATLFKLTHV